VKRKKRSEGRGRTDSSSDVCEVRCELTGCKRSEVGLEWAVEGCKDIGPRSSYILSRALTRDGGGSVGKLISPISKVSSDHPSVRSRGRK
jgi:hypothetical protein